MDASLDASSAAFEQVNITELIAFQGKARSRMEVLGVEAGGLQLEQRAAERDQPHPASGDDAAELREAVCGLEVASCFVQLLTALG